MLSYLSPERREELDCGPGERAIVVFYDQAIDYLHAAIGAIARNDIQERCDALTAAAELLGEMLQCMDLDSDDPIVANLHKIHTFIITRLPRVNVENDARFAAESIRLLKPIRDSWSVVARQAQAGATVVEVSPRIDPLLGRPKLTVVSPQAS